MTIASAEIGAMAASAAKAPRFLAPNAGNQDRQSPSVFSNIVACVDGSPQAIDVLEWAVMLSRNLNASLRTLHVLDTPASPATPQDPIAWELRRAEARRWLQGILEGAGANEESISAAEVLVGPFYERFRAFVADTPADLCVIGSQGEGNHSGHVIGNTARRIVETAACSVLIVPLKSTGDVARGGAALRRLMVPLDCSSRAETALPAAFGLAEMSGSEIVMAHSIPEPAITEIGPPDAADIALRKNVAARNRKAAERYMSRLQARYALDRRPIRTLILSGTDPRHQLVHAATEEMVDLVVLSAKGASGYADQPLGSVTDFVLNHCRTPLLIVRTGSNHKPANATSAVAGPNDEQTNPGRG